MTVNRKTAGIKIPDIFIRNDADDSTTGQILTSKAGTAAVALTGSNASILLSGTQAAINLTGGLPSIGLTGTGGVIYLANAGGTVGTLSLGAGNQLLLQTGATTGTIIDV